MRSRVLTLNLLTALVACQAHAATREFDGVVVSVDQAQQAFRVWHKPTGFETEVAWDAKTSFSARRWYDWDEVPDAARVEITVGTHDPKKHLLQVSNIALADPKTMPPGPQRLGWQKKVVGTLQRVPGDYSTGRPDLFMTQDRDSAP
jgi:hypothetical protein